MSQNRSSHSGMDATCSEPGLCYDLLVEQCVSCEKMQRNTEKETAGSIKTQVPTPLAADPACSSLLFGVYVVVGLVLAIAAMLCFVILKQKRRKRMRAAAKKDPTENEKFVISSEDEPHKGHGCSPGDGDPEILRCPHSNETLNTASNNVLKREVQQIAMAGSDVMEAHSLTSCDKKCNPTFPLPAIELGATVLVTTKTTQESVIWEEEES